jgi:hypothetical protein
MRGITLAVTAALAAILLAGTTGAVAADSLVVPLSSLPSDAVQLLPDNQSADVYGVGGGKTFDGMQKFDLSAHEGPNGDFGHVSVTYYNPVGGVIVSYSVDVFCVSIHNLGFGTPYDRGIIRGNVKKVTPVPNALSLDVGDVVDFNIKDGGNPSATTPVDDFYAPSSQGVPDTAPCRAFVYYPGFPVGNVTQGNVNIKGP